MDKYVKEIKAYTFPELTGEAKEKAKEWYLNDESLSWELTNNYESDLSCIFPNSDLKVQWSLSYCQGDGVNIYGSVNMEDIFVLLLSSKLNAASSVTLKQVFYSA